MEDIPVIYGLEDFNARTLVAQNAETEKINFIVGTLSLRSTNQILLLELDEETGTISKNAYEHSQGEIWVLDSSPRSSDLISTVFYNIHGYQSECNAAVFRMPIDNNKNIADSKSSTLSVEKLCSLGDCQPNSKINSLKWSPDNESRMVTLVDNEIILWDLEEAGKSAKIVGKSSVELKSTTHLGTARWNCHQDGSLVACTCSCGIVAWDLRTMSQVWNIEGAHQPVTRNFDFNPNRQYYMATCGDDCSIKIWDFRKPDKPIISQFTHSHWIWSVRYNPSYDQLLLTCSSDQRVVLTSLASVASYPLASLEGSVENEEVSKFDDSVLQKYENHEDSIYVAEWSAADCWTFASLSYDGRLVINKVPKKFKYKQFM